MTRRVQQACVWTRFSMSWAYTWGLCCSGGVENTVILPHVSQCSCSQAWRRAVVRAPCYGHALSSRQGWKARPWEVAAVFSRTLAWARELRLAALQSACPEHSPIGRAASHSPASLCLSVSVSLAPESLQCPCALWLLPTAGLVLTRRWSRKALRNGDLQAEARSM